jgi:hypothetical protein
MPPAWARKSILTSGQHFWQCLNLVVAAVCDRRKTALIERRYNPNFEIKTPPHFPANF